MAREGAADIEDLVRHALAVRWVGWEAMTRGDGCIGKFRAEMFTSEIRILAIVGQKASLKR